MLTTSVVALSRVQVASYVDVYRPHNGGIGVAVLSLMPTKPLSEKCGLFRIGAARMDIAARPMVVSAINLCSCRPLTPDAMLSWEHAKFAPMGSRALDPQYDDLFGISLP